MREVSLKFTQQDKNLLDNLLKMLGRAKMELEGVEILAAADSMRWLSRLQKQIEEEAKKPEVQITNPEPLPPLPKKKSKV